MTTNDIDKLIEELKQTAGGHRRLRRQAAQALRDFRSVELGLTDEIGELRAENEKLQADINGLLSSVQGQERIIKKLRAAIRWALGEEGDFPIVDGPPYYRWRTELRERSGLQYSPTEETQ